jgi:circadian clock protein KaiB
MSQHGDGKPEYVLQLYITGATYHSMLAVRNIKKICEKHVSGNYTLDIIDIYQHPEQARSENIIAIPTLVRIKPAPVRRLVGDLSNTDVVSEALGIWI